jgi:hypothetical protein
MLLLLLFIISCMDIKYMLLEACTGKHSAQLSRLCYAKHATETSCCCVTLLLLLFVVTVLTQNTASDAQVVAIR